MNFYHVASRKFCCCLPVRIGVFVLSLLSAFGGGIAAFALWYIVVRTAKYGTVNEAIDLDLDDAQNLNVTADNWQANLNSVALDKSQYYAFIIIAVIMTIYALFSVFGFIGAIARKRALVAFYSTALWFLLVVNLAVGIYTSYANIKRRSDLAAKCAEEAANDNDNVIAEQENKLTNAACNAATKVGIAVGIVVVVLGLLIQLYCCIIVKRYVEQLSEEQGYRSHVGGNKVAKGAAGAGSYYPHMALSGDQHHELMPAPKGGAYPYASNDHSFGHKV